MQGAEDLPFSSLLLCGGITFYIHPCIRDRGAEAFGTLMYQDCIALASPVVIVIRVVD